MRRSELSIPRRRATLLPAVLLAGAALALPRAAHAQQGRTISLGEAVEIALDRNTTVLRAEGDLRLTGAVRARERMDFLPDLRLSAGSSRSFGRSFSQGEGRILSETSDALDLEVAASVDLFRGFENVASLRRAGREREASAFRLERSRSDVVFQVVEGFVVLLLNRQLADVRAEELATEEELLRQVEQLVEVGRQPVSDLYQQQAARAEAEAALAEAERLVGVANTELIALLQLDPRGEYDFVAPALEGLAAAPAPEHSLDALLDAAYARRADLRALEATLAAHRQGVRVARSGYWPTVSLGFDYGSGWSSQALQPVPGTGTDPRVVTLTPDDGGPPVTFPIPGTGTDPDFERPDLVDQLDGRRSGAIRLTVGVPVFDRLATRTRVTEARIAEENAEYDLLDRRQEVALQVRQALLDLRSTRTQLDAAEARLRAAELARDAARRRYELGAATYVELAQVNAQYAAAASARVQARYRLVLARQLLAYHTGTLGVPDPTLPADGVEVVE